MPQHTSSEVTVGLACLQTVTEGSIWENPFRSLIGRHLGFLGARSREAVQNGHDTAHSSRNFALENCPTSAGDFARRIDFRESLQ